MHDADSWPYQLLGRPDSPPVLFLHGFMGSGTDWLPVAEPLSEYFLCLMPDLPGHGRNINFSLTEPLDFERLAAALDFWIARLGLGPVGMVGYSMGGRLALYAATRVPRQVKALVVESANAGLVAEADRRSRAAWDDQQANLVRTEGIETFVERWYGMDLFQSLQRRPKLLAQIKASRKQNDPRWAAKLISDLSPGRQPPVWDKLAQLSLPVLLLTGALDTKYRAQIRAMGPEISQAAIRIVPKAGHNVHLERPYQFVRLVKDFLQRHLPGDANQPVGWGK